MSPGHQHTHAQKTDEYNLGCGRQRACVWSHAPECSIFMWRRLYGADIDAFMVMAFKLDDVRHNEMNTLRATGGVVEWRLLNTSLLTHTLAHMEMQLRAMQFDTQARRWMFMFRVCVCTRINTPYHVDEREHRLDVVMSRYFLACYCAVGMTQYPPTCGAKMCAPATVRPMAQ